ncbi:MAG: flagellar assembly protein FliW [candidate division Zixibacteria bacterium]|nr:flagellar assembly protein FliW [candidate division Zixibacteria bacterium]
MPAIETSKFGEVTYDNKDVIEFIKPVLGFNDLTKYILISRPESEPFKWLQSLEDTSVCFVLIDPRLVVDQYTVEVSSHDIKLLDGSENQEDYQIYVIVTVPKGHPEQISINLKGPIVVNSVRLKALQMVLNNPDYDIRYGIFKKSQMV